MENILEKEHLKKCWENVKPGHTLLLKCQLHRAYC